VYKALIDDYLKACKKEAILINKVFHSNMFVLFWQFV